MTEVRKYGWRPDIKDPINDIPYLLSGKPIPPMMDLRPKMPPVYDQLALGSCTSNAIAGCIEYNFHIMNHIDFTPSRLFIYYNERAKEGTVNSDSGARISDGLYVVNKQGVCPETEWPYRIEKFATKPPKVCYKDALKDIVKRYKRLNNLTQIKDSIAQGYPAVFGFAVYESFESQEVADTGIVPMPKQGEQMLGGHAVLASGYNDSSGHVIVRNSWSDAWGDKGYFYLPYEYFTENLTDDYWTVFYCL